MNAPRAVISPLYDRVIKRSFFTHVAVGLFATLVLDGGVTMRVVGVALLAFWLGLAVIVLRRPLQPTPLDLSYIRWGFWPILLFAAVVQYVG